MPIELEESAKMDGCTELGILWKIILPLSKPVIATFTLLRRWYLERLHEWIALYQRFSKMADSVIVKTDHDGLQWCQCVSKYGPQLCAA